MAIEIQILSGAREGQRERFEKSVIAIGRHPMSDLRFDAERDLDVSGRHAELRGVEGRWTLHDMGSTNGTYLNGARVGSEVELHEGDVITFGGEGPRAQVHLNVAADAAAAAAPRASTPATALRRSAARPPAATPAESLQTLRRTTGERVAAAVREETRWLKQVLVIGGVALVGGVAIAFWLGHRESNKELEKFKQIVAQSESASVKLQGELMARGDTGVATEIRRRQDSLVAAARRAGLSPESASKLTAQLQNTPVQQLALLDFSKISASNDSAVAFLVSELDGKPYGGTAFAVTSSGMLITNKHNVRSDAGHPASRLAVKFANTNVFMPAHVVRESSTDDLALVQLDAAGTYPTVHGVSGAMGAAAVGSPLVVIGFPHSLDLPMDGDVVKTTLEVGTVSKRLPNLLQMDSYAGHGSSGSPVFDEHGEVIGVVWGGPREGQGRIVYAVPGDHLAAFLPPEAKGLVR